MRKYELDTVLPSGLTVEEWAGRVKLSPVSVRSMLNEGHRLSMISKAEIKPGGYHYPYKALGETRTLVEWSKLTGISRSALYHRIHRAKWSVEEAVTRPTREQKTSSTEHRNGHSPYQPNQDDTDILDKLRLIRYHTEFGLSQLEAGRVEIAEMSLDAIRSFLSE